MTIRVEEFNKLEDFLALLDGWRTEAANVGVDLRNVYISLPAFANPGFKHGASFIYDDSGIEDDDPFWQISVG